MGFGLSANAFMNGLMNGYRFREAIDERRRVLDERDRQRQQQEGYARALAQSLDNAQYQTVPYTATTDAAGQDLTDPEFGLKAAYGGGGPYAPDVATPGFGLRDIVGKRAAPDPNAFWQGAIRAAGEYGQAAALPGLMQGYMQDQNRQQTRADQQEQLAYNRQRDAVSDARWAQQQALNENQDTRAQESHQAALQKQAYEQKARQSEQGASLLDGLGDLLDARNGIAPEDAAQKAMEMFQLFPDAKKQLGVWGDKLMGLSPNPDNPGTYTALFDAGDGKEPLRKEITPDLLHKFAAFERASAGIRKEPGKTPVPHVIPNAQGLEQAGYFGPDNQWNWLGAGKAPTKDVEHMSPAEREKHFTAGVADILSKGTGIAKPEELDKSITTLASYLQVDAKTGRALPTAPHPGTNPSLDSFATAPAPGATTPAPTAVPKVAPATTPPRGAVPASAWFMQARLAGATVQEAFAEARKRIADGRLVDDITTR